MFPRPFDEEEDGPLAVCCECNEIYPLAMLEDSLDMLCPDCEIANLYRSSEMEDDFDFMGELIHVRRI